MNFWRIEAQTEKDFEWFEHKYPGWYAEFGDFWKWYASSASPGNQHPLQQRGGLCVSAPVLELHGSMPDPRRLRCDEVDGKMYTYCSEGCRWTHKVAFQPDRRPATPAMGRFNGQRELEDCYHGWDLADAIKELGFMRPDGKT